MRIFAYMKCFLFIPHSLESFNANYFEMLKRKVLLPSSSTWNAKRYRKSIQNIRNFLPSTSLLRHSFLLLLSHISRGDSYREIEKIVIYIRRAISIFILTHAHLRMKEKRNFLNNIKEQNCFILINFFN